MQRMYCCSERSSAIGAGRRGGRSWAGALVPVASLALAALATLGCDSQSFVPPQPPELRAAESGVPDNPVVPIGLARGLDTAPQSVPSIELVLDRRDPEEAALAQSAARVQAGLDHVKLNLSKFTEQDLPARQSELVREAIAKRAVALIIEPADTADSRMAEAVRDARAKGIPVVMLNRLLDELRAGDSSAGDSQAKTGQASSPAATSASAGASKTGRLVLVTAPSFAPFAKQVVAAAIRNAKNAQLEPEAGAIILINAISDPFAPERTAALREALQAAGIKPVDEITFAKSFEDGTKLLTERLTAKPTIGLVFTIDTQSCLAARETNNKIGETRPFIQAGFASESHISDLTMIGTFAAVAEFQPLRVIRRGVTAAADLAQGRDVPSRIEQQIRFYESPPRAGLPKSFEQMKKVMSKKKG